MIDTLSIVSYGGVVLWQSSSHETARRAMINTVIQNVLLEDRAGLREYVVDDYKMRWCLENEGKFVVIALYPKFVTSHYVGHFLREVSSAFAARYAAQTAKCAFTSATFDFDEDYRRLISKLESSERGSAPPQERLEVDSDVDGSVELPTTHDEREADEKETSEAIAQQTMTTMEGVGAAMVEKDKAGNDESCTTSVVKSSTPETSTTRAGTSYREGNVFVTKDGRRITVRGGHTEANKTHDTSTLDNNTSNSNSGRRKKPAKVPTLSSDPTRNSAMAAALRPATAEELDAQAALQAATYIKRLPNGAIAPVEEKVWEGQSRGRLANWLRGYVGKRELDESDLQQVIPHLREKLLTKNVALEVTEHVCRSVAASLTGTKLGTFDSLHRTVETAMVTALRRIMQPKHEVNILRDVAAAYSRGRPYTIVFCGVNGVGKSTSLAKVAYWLKQNGYSVLIVAGDTFRHGAVEQLEIHGRCLKMPVFQLGYGADPSAVAAAAKQQAYKQKIDVMLIDTAGRMQDHESRMRALAKLIHDSAPDLVLFVGEALVGNNGIDQLRKFNRCLVDYAPVGAASHGIDGIVLTKFDTIDDKVGAALSMVYELGQPIVFVGVGQTYQDLKVIDPEVVVSALMK